MRAIGFWAVLYVFCARTSTLSRNETAAAGPAACEGHSVLMNWVGRYVRSIRALVARETSLQAGERLVSDRRFEWEAFIARGW